MAYTRINWQDGESGGTPLSAENLNKMDKAIDDIYKNGDVVYSGDITETGTYSFTTNISNYRFFIVEMSASAASQRAYCIVPGNKIVSNNSMWISSNIEGSERNVRIAFETTYLNVLSINSVTHIRSVRGIL